ncbi:MAG: hypothetical protein AAF937_05090 [Planctomycetota bacterium]
MAKFGMSRYRLLWAIPVVVFAAISMVIVGSVSDSYYTGLIAGAVSSALLSVTAAVFIGWAGMRPLESRIQRFSDYMSGAPGQVLEQVGIEEVLETRDDAIRQIVGRVESAKKRVWVAGANLTQGENFNELLDQLQKIAKLRGPKFIRILLADPYCSAALFRVLLEEDEENVGTIIDNYCSGSPYGGATSATRPIRWFRDFKANFARLEGYAEFHDSIRFYSHVYREWMFVVDNDVYWQPVFLVPQSRVRFDRRDANERVDHRIRYGPVFRFTLRQNASPMARAIESHFDVLWSTAETSWPRISIKTYYGDPWLSAKGEVHADWFKEVAGYRSLSERYGFRRREPRHPWKRDPKPELLVDLIGDDREGSGDSIRIQIDDYSFHSLGGTIDASEIATTTASELVGRQILVNDQQDDGSGGSILVESLAGRLFVIQRAVTLGDGTIKIGMAVREFAEDVVD